MPTTRAPRTGASAWTTWTCASASFRPSPANGLLLVAGPTGAGKSTTLYAALTDVNRSEVNTVTVGDPVEYRVPRAYQVQVNEKRGLTFPTALRSILRSDPDIIMVGEIRDEVTAQLVIQASLSGHFVLSTITATTRRARSRVSPRWESRPI